MVLVKKGKLLQDLDLHYTSRFEFYVLQFIQLLEAQIIYNVQSILLEQPKRNSEL